MDNVDIMKVLIADQINQKGIEELKEVAEVIVRTDITPEELVKDIKDFDAIIVRSRTKVTKEVIEVASNLKIIARAGVGVDNVDVQAATERGIMAVSYTHLDVYKRQTTDCKTIYKSFRFCNLISRYIV